MNRDEIVRAVEEALAYMRPVRNGFPRNAHCARSKLRELLGELKAEIPMPKNNSRSHENTS